MLDIFSASSSPLRQYWLLSYQEPSYCFLTLAGEEKDFSRPYTQLKFWNQQKQVSIFISIFHYNIVQMY